MIKIIVILISLIGSIVTVYLSPINNIYGVFALGISLFIGYIIIQVLLFFLVSSIICLPISKKKHYKHYNKRAHQTYVLFTDQCLDIFGVKLSATGKEILPLHDRFVLVCNHLSNVDPIMINSYLREYPLVCMAKQSLKKIPWFGRLITKAGYLFVKRDGSMDDALEVAKGIKYLKNNECSICIFPEGSRNKTDDKPLLDFKGGAAELALKSQKGIAVSCVYGTQEVNDNLLFKSHKVNYEIFKFLSYEEIKDKTSSQINEILYDLMYSKVMEMSEKYAKSKYKV
ncbi:MAG: 1-acyl-sn-glycerol-3-phosphate acyltransferase [Bacilli bacterium]|nr:1-acyl-sn-glycerol-3-phosphate acyltransferase [Bacilli bacterium]